jgi:hypothetical protein
MPGPDRASHIPYVMPDLIGHLFYLSPTPPGQLFPLWRQAPSSMAPAPHPVGAGTPLWWRRLHYIVGACAN